MQNFTKLAATKMSKYTEISHLPRPITFGGSAVCDGAREFGVGVTAATKPATMKQLLNTCTSMTTSVSVTFAFCSTDQHSRVSPN